MIEIRNLTKRYGSFVAVDDISFDRVTEKCIEMFRGKTISLITDSQHLHQIDC